MSKKILLALFSLFAAILAWAQPPHSFTRYGRENNFSGTTVEDMAQDQHGQLWLATWGGLYSFDGRTFQNYRTGDPDDRENPRSNHFVDVEILENGEILTVSYDNRLFRFNPETGDLDPVDSRGQGIQGIFRPQPDALYFLTMNGEMLDASFSSFCRLPADVNVRGMVAGPDGSDWILTDRGIYRNGRLSTEIPAFCATTAEGGLYIGSAGEL
ncbi:MAG: two-component regulator propeller domain-containing protein, partial [bacterium]